MNNFTLIAALSLCSFGCISASGSHSQTVEVQPGNEVTLQCNMNDNGVVIFWFRLVNGTKVSCVSVKIHPADAQNCEGFGNGRLEMTSNDSTVSLKISSVAKSDAGLYICGLYTSGNLTFNVVRLDVKGSDEPHDDEDRIGESDRIAMLTSVILGALTVVLVVLVLVIIGLVVKVRNLQTAVEKEQNPEQIENLGRDDDVNYASVTIRPKAKRRELEPNVIYASTR